MELTELVKNRRSTRSYTEDRITKADIEQIIACAQMAPSWKNFQTGRYYVALSDEAIAKVYESLPEFNQKSSKNAAYIVATFKKDRSGFSLDGNPEKAGNIWGGYDLGLQNAYLILKACELGYDTLIMGLRDEDSLRDYFEITDDEIILPVIAIGKKASPQPFRPRKEINEILTIK